MTTKKLAISAFTAVILIIVIRAILRGNGIHNFLSDNSIGGFLLCWVAFSLISLFFRRQSDK